MLFRQSLFYGLGCLKRTKSLTSVTSTLWDACRPIESPLRHHIPYLEYSNIRQTKQSTPLTACLPTCWLDNSLRLCCSICLFNQCSKSLPTMSFPVRSTSPCVRKALHERTPSHSNERSPTRSLRIVPDEELDMYTATPFPTKPEQILLPLPGKGQQQYISDTGFSYSDHQGPSTSAYPSPACSEPAANSPRDHSMGSWDVSSTVDTGNSPPPMWDDDPSSSKSSLPDDSGKARDHGAESSEVEFSDDEMMVLPTTTPTIKTVLSEPSMSSKSPAESVTDYSSPILEQIGVPSSPNFVMLDNSSTIFHRPATARPRSP